MFPSFGYQYSPGDLLSSKTFEKVASVDVETVSDEEVRTHVCYQSIDSSKLLTGLCDMFRCKSGQHMINAILKDEERFESLLNFLFSQPHHFPCFGYSVIRKENESCFEICSAENSPADLMVSKTFSGTFFLYVLTSKLPIKDQDLITKKFAYLLEEIPSVSKEHCEYFDNEGIKVTVFANWNEMVCSQVSVRDSFAKLIKYDEDCKQRLVFFEVDEISKCLSEHPLPFDPSFETCYRLMRNIKYKGAEFQHIYDSKKKKNNEKTSVGRMKILLADLQKELKQTYFLKFEHIEQMNGIFVDVMNVLKTGLENFLSAGTVGEPSLYQMMETCLTLILTKHDSGNCIIRDNTVFYNAENMDKLMEYFGKKPFIALKSGTDNFKRWITLEFLQKYPLCYVQQYPDIPDSLVFYDGAHIYGFGTVTLKKNSRKQRTEFANVTFCCVNPEHKFERFWKCTNCNDYVATNGKEILCKCGLNFVDNVEIRCSLSGGKICTKKPIQTPRRRNDVNIDNKGYNTVNIVLFGPVGSGKSTLVNAAMNYMEYSTYKDASSRPLIAQIPYKFSIRDDHHKEHIICSKELPENCPENFSSTSGITMEPRAYEYYCNGKSYRFVDTVGYGSTVKSGFFSNLNFWKNLKHIEAIWITVSANQNLGNDDSWIRSIVKCIPKLLYPRIYFVFTNIQGKHSLRFNTNAAVVTKFFSCLREFSFDEKNVFAIENDCLNCLYAQRDGCSLTEIQDSVDKTWMKTRRVVLDLLGKAFASKTTVSKSHDDDVFFLNNLFYLYIRLKNFCSDDDLIQCFNLLKCCFASSSLENREKRSTYGDVMKSLQKITDDYSEELCQPIFEFLKTFEDFVKSQSPGLVGTLVSKLYSWLP